MTTTASQKIPAETNEGQIWKKAGEEVVLLYLTKWLYLVSKLTFFYFFKVLHDEGEFICDHNAARLQKITRQKQLKTNLFA